MSRIHSNIDRETLKQFEPMLIKFKNRNDFPKATSDKCIDCNNVLNITDNFVITNKQTLMKLYCEKCHKTFWYNAYTDIRIVKNIDNTDG